MDITSRKWQFSKKKRKTSGSPEQMATHANQVFYKFLLIKTTYYTSKSDRRNESQQK